MVPPTVVVTRRLSRRQPAGHRRDRGHAARAGDQRRREHALHVVAGHRGRRADAHRHLQARHRPRPGAGAGAEPRQPGAAAAARGSAPARRHHVKSSPDLTMVVHLVSPDGATTSSTCATTPCSRSRTSSPASPASARCSVFGGGDYAMRIWLDPERSRRAASPPATSSAPSASRTCRSPPASSARRRCPTGSPFSCTRQRAGPAHQRGGVRRDRHQDRRERRAHPAQGRGPHRARRRQTTALRSLPRQQARRRHRHLPAARLERARSSPTDVRADDGGAQEATSRRASTTASSTTPPCSCASRSTRSSRRCFEAIAARGHRRGAVPADLARLDHPAGRRAGLASSAPSP